MAKRRLSQHRIALALPTELLAFVVAEAAAQGGVSLSTVMRQAISHFASHRARERAVQHEIEEHT